MTFASRREIGWRHWKAIGPASTALGSMINIGFASGGKKAMRLTWN